MSEKGWIILDRKIRDNWIWNEKPFNKLQAWVDLLLSANHKDSTINFDGKPIVVRRGTFITSIRKLSEKWGWSKDRVCRFLDLLSKDSMITRNSDTHRTLITIVNYSFFQGQRDTNKDTDKDSNKDTRKDTDKDTVESQTTMINNDKQFETKKQEPPAVCPSGLFDDVSDEELEQMAERISRKVRDDDDLRVLRG